MGMKAEDPLDMNYEDLGMYLRGKHAMYMQIGEDLYYLTDANSHFWRAQCTEVLNEKGHYTDCSDLVQSMDEFLSLGFIDGKTIEEVFDQATFYASEKPEV